MNIRAALYAKLAAASSVTSKLAPYVSGPAIFTARPVPQNAARPYLALSLVADPSEDVLTTVRRRAVFDVTCVADFTGSMKALDELAEAVRAALHQQRLTIAGRHHIETRCLGSAEAPTDATLAGVTLTFEIRAQ